MFSFPFFVDENAIILPSREKRPPVTRLSVRSRFQLKTWTVRSFERSIGCPPPEVHQYQSDRPRRAAVPTQMGIHRNESHCRILARSEDLRSKANWVDDVAVPLIGNPLSLAYLQRSSFKSVTV